MEKKGIIKRYMGIFTKKTRRRGLVILAVLAVLVFVTAGVVLKIMADRPDSGTKTGTASEAEISDGDSKSLLQTVAGKNRKTSSDVNASKSGADTSGKDAADRGDDPDGEEEAEPVPFKVTEYDQSVTMYANTRVNIRYGADTSYRKITTVPFGTMVTVSGETDTGWYEVHYDGELGYMKCEYLQKIKPGTAFVFAGDSRTVQMSQAVKKTDHSWIAKVGEGYTWFSDTAVAEIDKKVGAGTRLILNFGVNDLYDSDKYISRINSHVDTWIAAGATVYYAAVTPVGEGPSVTNAEIESFNKELKDGLDSRIIWLDGYSFLTENGFSSRDGLHYDFDTYRSLYAFYIQQME